MNKDILDQIRQIRYKKYVLEPIINYKIHEFTFIKYGEIKTYHYEYIDNELYTKVVNDVHIIEDNYNLGKYYRKKYINYIKI